MVNPRATGRLLLLHAAVLGLWAGSLAMAALTAAVAFPTMKRLDPSLPAYQAMPEGHWSIAAGHVANQVLTAAVWGQVVFAAGALLSFAASGRAGSPRGAVLRAAHGLLVLVAAVLVAFHASSLQPRMQQNVRAYWAAAEAGRTDEALGHKNAFDADHPLASRVMGATLVLVLASMGIVVVRGVGPGARPEAAGS